MLPLSFRLNPKVKDDDDEAILEASSPVAHAAIEQPLLTSLTVKLQHTLNLTHTVKAEGECTSEREVQLVCLLAGHSTVASIRLSHLPLTVTAYS